MTRRKSKFENVGFAHVDDVPLKRWEKPAARKVSFGDEVAVMAIMTLVFGALVGAGFQFEWVWMLVAGIMALIGLWTTYALYLIRTTTIAVEKKEYQDITGQEVEEDPQVKNPNAVVIPLADGRVIEFLEPKTGEFVNWATAVVNDLNNDEITFREKTQLSQNTGVKRGWPKEVYKAMIASLSLAGWVTTGPNNTPVLTNYGRTAMDAWLRMEVPPAPPLDM